MDDDGQPLDQGEGSKDALDEDEAELVPESGDGEFERCDDEESCMSDRS